VILLLDSRALRPVLAHRRDLIALEAMAPTILMDEEAAHIPARELGITVALPQGVHRGHLLKAVRRALAVGRYRADPSLAGAW
jgi:hypothetical protein